VPRSSRTCAPCGRLESVRGLAALVQPPLSRLVSKTRFAVPVTVSLPLKMKFAVVLPAKEEGPETKWAVGGVVSTVQSYSAGVAVVLPAWSVARNRRLCCPALRPVRFKGLLALTQAPLSRLLWKVRLDGGLKSSLPENTNVAVLLFVMLA